VRPAREAQARETVKMRLLRTKPGIHHTEYDERKFRFRRSVTSWAESQKLIPVMAAMMVANLREFTSGAPCLVPGECEFTSGDPSPRGPSRRNSFR
jgi:hypothetical protein